MAAEPTDVKTIHLNGPITLYEVGAVRETLRDALAEGRPLQIDLTDSGPWDLAGLQLLISCAKTARTQDQTVRLKSVPKACAEIAERSGLAEWLRTLRD